MKFKTPYNNFDLLNIPISLSYNNQYLYRTFVGATLTIILFIIIITYFIYQFIQIFNKSSFSIISNEFQNPKESIDFTNVPILFGLTDDVGNPLQLDPKVAKYFVILNEYRQQIDKKGNSNTQHIQTILQTERCDKLKDSLDLSLFHGYNISYFQCIKPSQNITINGSYGNISGYKSLKINIKKCNNENDNCLNTNNIDSIISNSRFMVIYRGYKTNFYDLDTKDIEQTIYSRSITLSPYFLKRVFYYMSLVKYNLYDNIFSNFKIETQYYINRGMIIENEPIKNESYDKDTLPYYSFVYDGNVVEYTKKVKQIIDAISYIGNLFNIMLTLFRIINNFFSNKILFIDIFYKFFFGDKFCRTKTYSFDVVNFRNLQEQKNKKIESKIERKNGRENTLTLNSLVLNKSINSINFNSNVFLENAGKSTKNISLLNLLSGRNYTNKLKNKGIKRYNNKSIEKEKNDFIKNTKYYYLCPICIIKNKKNLETLLFVKNSICNCFSLETFIEFIKIEKAVKFEKKLKATDILYTKYGTSKNLKEEINKIFSLN